MKDKLTEDNLDLSMCDLKTVPVKDIVSFCLIRISKLTFLPLTV